MRKALSILGRLSDSDVEWMISTGLAEDIPPGTTILRAGEPVASIAMLLDGHLGLTGEDGICMRLSPGEFVGQISTSPSRETVQTIDACRILRIQRSDLVARCADDDAFADRMEHVLNAFVSQRLQLALADSDSETFSDDSIDGEIDFAALEQLALAGRRFEMIVARLNR